MAGRRGAGMAYDSTYGAARANGELHPLLCDHAAPFFDRAHELGLSAKSRGVLKYNEDPEIKKLTDEIVLFLDGKSGKSLKQVWGQKYSAVVEMRPDKQGRVVPSCKYPVLGQHGHEMQRRWTHGFQAQAKANPKPLLSYEEWYLAMANAVRREDRASVVALQMVMDLGAVGKPRPERVGRSR